MAKTVEFTFGGIPEMRANLKRIRAAVSGESLARIAEVGAEVIRGDAARRASVDLSTLRNSMTTERREATETRAVVAIGPGREAPYAKYVEYGTGLFAEGGGGRQTPWVYYYEGRKGPRGFRTTHGSRPHPMVRPAFDEMGDKALREVGKAAERVIKAAAR